MIKIMKLFIQSIKIHIKSLMPSLPNDNIFLIVFNIICYIVVVINLWKITPNEWLK